MNIEEKTEQEIKAENYFRDLSEIRNLKFSEENKQVLDQKIKEFFDKHLN